jgi:hypothetical protein
LILDGARPPTFGQFRRARRAIDAALSTLRQRAAGRMVRPRGTCLAQPAAMRKQIAFGNFIVLVAAVAGCGTQAPPISAAASGYAVPDRPAGLPTAAESYRVTKLSAPASSADFGYGFGDPNVQHNRLGNILGFVSSSYTPADPIQARYDRAIADGDIGLTFLVEHYDEGAASDTSITVDSKVSDDGFTTLWGIHDGNRVEATGGDMTLSLSVLPGIHLHAEAMRVEATLGDDGLLHGRIDGVIPQSELVKVYPVAAAAMNDYVARATPDDNDAKTTLALFDTDKNGTIDGAELAASPIVRNLTAPDVTLDVVDVGTVEGLSFGMGFDAVRE